MNLTPLGISFGEGDGTPLQYSCLENPMDRGAWWPAVHGVAKSWTLLSDFTFTFHFHAWEKEMATHSSVLAWRIPGMGEPGGLPSMGWHRVGHDWSDLAAAGAGSRKDISMAYWSSDKNTNSISENPKSITACFYQADSTKLALSWPWAGPSPAEAPCISGRWFFQLVEIEE